MGNVVKRKDHITVYMAIIVTTIVLVTVFVVGSVGNWWMIWSKLTPRARAPTTEPTLPQDYILEPNEIKEVFSKELIPDDYNLDLSYTASLSISYEVKLGAEIVYKGKCKESNLKIKFSVSAKQEIKVTLENHQETKVSVNIKISVTST